MRRACGRRAFAIVAVLIVMTGALLVASALLAFSQANAADGTAALERAQSRALAWSGLQAIMVRLDEQRQEILEGRLAELEDRYVIYETTSGSGVVRLLPVGAGGERLVSEAALLDLTRADGDMLQRSEQLDAAQAGALVAHRDGLPGGALRSIGSLLVVPEISAEDLWGPAEDLAKEPDAMSATETRSGSVAGVPRGLADVATVFSFEPALQRGGRGRLSLAGVTWSEELSRRLAERFDASVVDAIQRVLEGGADLSTEAGLSRALVSAGIDPAAWPEIVDTFTPGAGGLHFGRLDINAAPYEALSALPGLEAGQAAAIIDARGDLSDEERSTIAWPAIKGILDPDQYVELAGWITTRSWVYRVRFEAGLEVPGQGGGPLSGRIVWEAVIDLCEPAARLADLRDVTLLPLAAAIALDSDAVEDEPGADAPLPEPGDTAAEPGEPASPPRESGRIGRWRGS